MVYDEDLSIVSHGLSSISIQNNTLSKTKERIRTLEYEFNSLSRTPLSPDYSEKERN